jgi:hypothetical protein
MELALPDVSTPYTAPIASVVIALSLGAMAFVPVN